MKINEKIRSQREMLGMSIEEVARSAGLSVPQCIDVEKYEDEFVSTLMLVEAKRLCDSLKLDIADIVGLGRSSSTTVTQRSVLIRERRSELRISAKDLADFIGFDECVVGEMEANEGYLDEWPVELIVKVADFLKVPPLELMQG